MKPVKNPKVARTRNGGTWTEAALHVLRRLFSYNPETGDVVRIASGTVVPKTPGSHGYPQVECSIGGNRFACTQHALAWFLTHGSMPHMLDHINGDKLDNRLNNLRASNTAHNNLNRHKKSGRDQHLPPGVYERSRKGRPGIWFECKVQFGEIVKSTYKRNREDAIAYVAQHRLKMLELAAP